MAHGGDLFAIGDGVPSEQNFETAFRGYKQDQVDNFVRLINGDTNVPTPQIIAAMANVFSQPTSKK